MTSKLKWIVGLTGISCLLLFAGLIALLYFIDSSNRYFDARLQLKQQLVYEVNSGEGVIQTVGKFAELKLVSQPPPDVLLKAMLHHQGLQFGIKRGEYLLTPLMRLSEALKLFNSGEVIHRRWTLLEGTTLIDFISTLVNHPSVTIDIPEVSSRADYAKLARSIGLKRDNPEGLFLADTYFFEKGTSASELLSRADQALKQLQQGIKKCASEKNPSLVKLTAYQQFILASIIEKETGLGSERSLISAVFHNRLKRGMYLQTDPTVIYGMGDAYTGNITRVDLRRQTPYNTYTFAGLPPTPIASFGEASLQAACNPDEQFLQQGMLYFVGKGDGSHQFSKTLEEHNRAVQHFQINNRKKNYRSSASKK